MTSDYVDVLHGVLRYSDEAWESVKKEEDVKNEIALVGEERARRAGVLLDISKDGYFTVEKCIPDFKKVRRQINDVAHVGVLGYPVHDDVVRGHIKVFFSISGCKDCAGEPQWKVHSSVLD